MPRIFTKKDLFIAFQGVTEANDFLEELQVSAADIKFRAEKPVPLEKER
ncbi:MAG: hypothetical protein AAGB12_03725 [Pseudomonadota bacterium]